MSTVMRDLHEDHKNLSKLLDLLGGQIEIFHQGQQPDFDLMIDVMDYIENYSDVIHHPKEDLIYNAMRERSDLARDAIDRLLEEHKVLAESTKEFRQTLEGIMGDAVISRDTVEQRAAEFIDMLRRHLNIEEGQVFPLVGEVLSDEELASIEATLAGGAPLFGDPLFGDTVDAHYHNLYQHIMAMEQS